MPNITVADSLKYAHLQMAAEAFLNAKENPDYGVDPDLFIRALKRGNDHSSRFTDTDAADFAAHWEVVDQEPNTGTGFSGTLFRCIKADPLTGAQAGELVMCMRSTEFIDDYARDNQGTNKLEIGDTGFAWGQIRDMEAWYARLQSSGKLLVGQSFSVTGYSLGGHLATVFNLLHGGPQSALDKVVTFNAAGVGGFKEQTGLAPLVAQFITQSGQKPQIDDTVLSGIYDRVDIALAQNQAIDAEDNRILNKLAHPNLEAGEVVDGRTQQLALWMLESMRRIQSIRDQNVYSQTLHDSNGKSPTRVDDVDIGQLSLNYQMALLDVSQHTDGASLMQGLALAFNGKQYIDLDDERISNQFDLVGDTKPSAVSNSQWHIGQDVLVPIEDQPLWRGAAPTDIAMASFRRLNVSLLVDRYDKRDFGDTHSLALIVDSLNAQNTLLSMLPQASREQAAKVWKTVFANASNLEARHGSTFVGEDQGKAEGDLLENIVNALAALALGPEKFQSLRGSPDGNTWHMLTDSGVYTGRNRFSELLSQIRNKSDLFKAANAGELTLELAETSSIKASSARNDFGVFAALYGLSPFVFKGANPVAFEAAVSEAWGEVYSQWKKDQSAIGGGNAAPLFTDEWINQRAQLLVRKNYYGASNAAYDSSAADAYGADKATLYDNEDIVWEDRSSALKIQRGGTTESTRYVTFNNDSGGQLNGARREDYLFGGAGTDTLMGLGGNDYLQGNAGDDVLDGGIGNDTLQGGVGDDAYIFAGDWGVDEIIDSDGVGSIVVDGQTLVGGRFVSAGAWISEDEKWRYSLSDSGDLIISNAEKAGRIIIRNYAGGQSKSTSLMKNAPGDVLGLHLPDSAQPWVNTPGMYALQGDQLGRTDSSWRIQSDGSIPGAQADPDANNVLDGSSFYPDVVVRPAGGDLGSDGVWRPVYVNTQAVSYWGKGGNDFISGEQYEDYLDGGDGDDAIWGGAGSDTIYGGKGDDIIVTNMAATMPGGFGELPRDPDEIKGPDNVVTQTSGPNITRWFVVRTADGSRVRVERAHVKNPDGGEFYAPESASDQDFVDAGEGDDYVWGGRGADYLIGGAGDDHLAGLAGSDVILGGDGKDLIYGDEWVRMRLQAVYSSLDGDAYASLPYDDALKSPALHGDDVIDGGGGDDEVWGDGGNDSIWGGGGNDLLLGDALLAQLPYENHGNDQLDGGDGNDVLIGLGKDDTLRGGSGNDELWGDHSSLDAQYHGSDLLDGGEGDDKLFGQGGSDTLHGGAGDDWLAGEDEMAVDATSALTGDDILSGGEGNDTVIGGNGNDQLSGDEGDDWLYGGAGNDALDGGSGLNSLEGGAGNDTYTSASATGTDVIVDSEGDDTYQIDLRALSAGASVDIDDTDGVGRLMLDGVLLTKESLQAVAEDVWVTAGCQLSRNGTDLVIRANGGSGRALVYDFFTKGSMFGLTLPVYVPPIIDGGGTPTDGDDTLYGDEGDNSIDGGLGNDKIFGLGGVDQLAGGAGDDSIEGGAGNDYLIDGQGNDTYIFGRGDGQDFLYADHNSFDNEVNTIQFKEGISTNDVQVRIRGTSLYFLVNGESGDSIELAYIFDNFSENGNSNKLSGLIKKVKFADGTIWDSIKIMSEAQRATDGNDRIFGTDEIDILYGGAGNDQIWAFGGDDTVYGGDGFDSIGGGKGNDVLYGGEGDDGISGYDGNDILDGGSGNDFLRGERGNDTYIFGKGYGQDVIDLSCYGSPGPSEYGTLRFKEDVAPNEIIATRENWDLVLSIAGTTDSIRVVQFFYVSEGHSLGGLSLVKKFQFTDGTVWDVQAINNLIQLGQGTSGDDIISGDEGDNILGGGAGNDKIYGYGGNDILDGGDGDDELFGDEGNDSLFGGNGADRLIGSVGNDNLQGQAGNDVLFGDSGDDVLEGGDGDDALEGANGDDQLFGGAGNDTLAGGIGSNIFDGGSGDDTLVGGAGGKDIFLFGKGDGSDDIVYGQYRLSELHFKDNVSANEVLVERVNQDLVLSIIGTTDKITLDYFFNTESNQLISPICQVNFADGTIWDMETLKAKANGDPTTNGSPVVGQALVAQSVEEDSAVSLQIPAAAFSDPDGDPLSY
ncbi:calcium-binding protein, partial [Comamonas testosteroni]